MGEWRGGRTESHRRGCVKQTCSSSSLPHSSEYRHPRPDRAARRRFLASLLIFLKLTSSSLGVCIKTHHPLAIVVSGLLLPGKARKSSRFIVVRRPPRSRITRPLCTLRATAGPIKRGTRYRFPSNRILTSKARRLWLSSANHHHHLCHCRRRKGGKKALLSSNDMRERARGREEEVEEEGGGRGSWLARCCSRARGQRTPRRAFHFITARAAEGLVGAREGGSGVGAATLPSNGCCAQASSGERAGEGERRAY